MKAPLALLVLLVLGTLPGFSATLRSDVDAALAELRKLEAMKPGKNYTALVGGQPMTAPKDAFLRRRTADEIARSGLSCGCGDYAILFIDLMESRGYETRMVDSAQISLLSLASQFAGHSVVAVRAKSASETRWWLVDSTSRKVLSTEWSAEEKSFTSGGSLYWIGYVGPLETYPARSPEQLRQFYRQTLATVPVAVLNRVIPQLNFVVDSTLSLPDNKYRNPNIPRLSAEQARLFAQYNITPERSYDVHLTRGGDDYSGTLKSVDGQWVATVGLRSACSPSFLSYMASAIVRQQADTPRRSEG